MEAQAPSPDGILTAESAQLVKALLERDAVAEEQEDKSPERKDVDWVSSEDFTVETGKAQIEEYIQTWGLHPRWLHSLDYLCATAEEHRTFHHYRARFSAPTPRRPVRGTAGVYFALGVSEAGPGRNLPVGSSFAVESHRLAHTPGKTRFREKWLADVVESKALLRNAAQL